MSRLALTLPADPREMPTSYLSRLAARNHASAAIDFANDVGLDHTGIVCGDAMAVSHLRQLAGLPEDCFDLTTVVKTSTMRYRIGCEVMNTQILARGELRYCPACLREGLEGGSKPWEVIHCLAWQVIQVRCCPRHGVRLRSYRPIGAAGISYDFTAALASNLLDFSGQDQRVCLDGLDQYLSARIVGTVAGVWCDILKLPELVKCCEAFGILLEHGRDMRAGRLSAEERRDCMNIGFHVLAQGPAAIRNALDGFNHRTPTRGGNQPHPSHGDLQRLLGNDSAKRPDLEPLRAIVREYFLNNYPYRPGTVVLGHVVEQSRVLSFRRACREVRIRGSLMEILLTRRGLASRSEETGLELKGPITRAVVDEIRREQRDFLDPKQTIELLGCTFAMLKQLQRADILIATEGPGIHRRKGVERKSLTVLLQAVAGPSTLIAEAPPHLCLIDLATRKLRCSVPDIVSILRDGRVVAPARLTKKLRLGSLLIDPRQLSPFLHASKRNVYSQIDTMKRLSIDKETLDELVAQGYLNMKRMRSDVTRVTRDYLTSDSVEAFDSKYATLGTLARGEGVHWMKLRKYVEGLPAAIGSISTRKIYRRADLSTLADGRG